MWHERDLSSTAWAASHVTGEVDWPYYNNPRKPNSSKRLPSGSNSILFVVQYASVKYN